MKSFNPEVNDFTNTYETRWDHDESTDECGLCYYAEEEMFYVYEGDNNTLETKDFKEAYDFFMFSKEEVD